MKTKIFLAAFLASACMGMASSSAFAQTTVKPTTQQNFVATMTVNLNDLMKAWHNVVQQARSSNTKPDLRPLRADMQALTQAKTSQAFHKDLKALQKDVKALLENKKPASTLNEVIQEGTKALQQQKNHIEQQLSTLTNTKTKSNKIMNEMRQFMQLEAKWLQRIQKASSPTHSTSYSTSVGQNHGTSYSTGSTSSTSVGQNHGTSYSTGSTSSTSVGQNHGTSYSTGSTSSTSVGQNHGTSSSTGSTSNVTPPAPPSSSTGSTSNVTPPAPPSSSNGNASNVTPPAPPSSSTGSTSNATPPAPPSSNSSVAG